jgi:hypothetical protein
MWKRTCRIIAEEERKVWEYGAVFWQQKLKVCGRRKLADGGALL